MTDKTFHWSGYASARSGYGLISVTNNSRNRACTVKMERFDIREWAPGDNQTAMNSFVMQKISACNNDGIDVIPVSLVANTSLPSQVKCCIQSNITKTADTPYSYNTPFTAGVYNAIIGSTQTLASWAHHAKGGRGASSRVDGSSMGTFGYGSSSVTGIKLNEGEGFAILPISDNNHPIRYNYWLNVLIRDDANNRTYSISSDLTPSDSSSKASFALFNGSGSGLSLTVLSLNISFLSDEFDTQVQNRIKFIRTKGNFQDGEVVQSLSSDPRNSVPNDITITRGHIGAGYLIKPIHDITGGFTHIFNFYNSGIGGSLTQTAQLETRRNPGILRECWPNVRYRPNMTNASFKMYECFSLNQFGDRRLNTNTDSITLAPGTGFVVLLDSYMANRSFAAFGEKHGNCVTYNVDITFSYDSGVRPIAGAKV